VGCDALRPALPENHFGSRQRGTLDRDEHVHIVERFVSSIFVVGSVGIGAMVEEIIQFL
jgi:hypothetical protein